MRKSLLLALLLAACGSDDPAAVKRSFEWKAPEGEQVTAAAFLPNGDLFVGLAGTAPRGVFLSPTGEEKSVFELGPLCGACGGLRPAQPLAIGTYALFGPEAGGEPLLRIEPATQRVRHLPLENPRNLQLGTFFLDGRRAAAMKNGTQVLLPGSRLLQLSAEGIVTATHPTPPLLAVAHVRDDIWTFIDEDQVLGGWREGDNSVADFALPVARIAGGDGFTIVGLHEEGTIELFAYGDPLRPLGHAFVHEIELAVAPAARRLVVGVRDRPLDAPAVLPEAPAPRTALVLESSGKLLGEVQAPAPITAVHISADGRHALVAHEGGVLGLELRQK